MLSKSSKYSENVAELKYVETKVEEEDLSTQAAETFNPYGTASLLVDIPLHGAYQIPSRTPSVSGATRTPSGYSQHTSFELPILGEDTDIQSRRESEHNGEGSSRSTPNVDLRSPYFPYPENCQNSYFGIFKSYVGSSPIEPLHSLPIEATRRNAELFHLFKWLTLIS